MQARDRAFLPGDLLPELFGGAQNELWRDFDAIDLFDVLWISRAAMPRPWSEITVSVKFPREVWRLLKCLVLGEAGKTLRRFSAIGSAYKSRGSSPMVIRLLLVPVRWTSRNFTR
jgi:hypothetical protein